MNKSQSSIAKSIAGAVEPLSWHIHKAVQATQDANLSDVTSGKEEPPPDV